ALGLRPVGGRWLGEYPEVRGGTGAGWSLAQLRRQARLADPPRQPVFQVGPDPGRLFGRCRDGAAGPVAPIRLQGGELGRAADDFLIGVPQRRVVGAPGPVVGAAGLVVVAAGLVVGAAGLVLGAVGPVVGALTGAGRGGLRPVQGR